MALRTGIAAFLLALALWSQTPDFTCPMDPEIRQKGPGKCPRCGMKLEARIADLVEYPIRFAFQPARIPPGVPVTLTLEPRDPKTGKPVAAYETVHEKLMHLFVYSSDLTYFAHLHPERKGPGFILPLTLPRPGIYKLMADYYPSGGTPQLNEKVITTAGFTGGLPESLTTPAADIGKQQGENMSAELRMEPAQPIPGKKTLLFLKITPTDGLEQFIGAWAHMLIASNDLIDTIHEHPTYADGGSDMQFDVFFPRAATYKVWVQIQRKGVVNTLAFVIPVAAL